MDINSLLQSMIREISELATGISDEEAQTLADAIIHAQKIFIAGAGRSGCMVRAFAIRLVHLGFQVHTVGSIETPASGPEDLLLMVSGSGETESMKCYLKMAKKNGTATAVVTGQPDSSLARQTDYVFYVPSHCCGKLADGSVALTRTSSSEHGEFRQPMGNAGETCTLLALDAVGLLIMKKIGATELTMNARHANIE